MERGKHSAVLVAVILREVSVLLMCEEDGWKEVWACQGCGAEAKVTQQ